MSTRSTLSPYLGGPVYVAVALASGGVTVRRGELVALRTTKDGDFAEVRDEGGVTIADIDHVCHGSYDVGPIVSNLVYAQERDALRAKADAEPVSEPPYTEADPPTVADPGAF